MKLKKEVFECCSECGEKLTLPDEIKYGICRGCGGIKK